VGYEDNRLALADSQRLARASKCALSLRRARPGLAQIPYGKERGIPAQKQVISTAKIEIIAG
jgi:hypothetical protein